MSSRLQSYEDPNFLGTREAMLVCFFSVERLFKFLFTKVSLSFNNSAKSLLIQTKNQKISVGFFLDSFFFVNEHRKQVLSFFHRPDICLCVEKKFLSFALILELPFSAGV